MRPVARTRHVTVLHRIDVDVVDVIGQITIIADRVLPITALPDAAFASRLPRGVDKFVFRDGSRKSGFDRTPASGVVRVTLRQHPNRVHVVRQHHSRDDFKRPFSARRSHRIAQRINVTDQQVVAPAFKQIYREEIRSSRSPVAQIVGHLRILLWCVFNAPKLVPTVVDWGIALRAEGYERCVRNAPYEAYLTRFPVGNTDVLRAACVCLPM